MARVRPELSALLPLLQLLCAGCGATSGARPASDAANEPRTAGDACASSACDAASPVTSDVPGPPPPDAALEVVADTNGADNSGDTAAETPPVDTSRDAPPAGCPGLFCEDFESGALDPGKWSATSGANHVDDATPPSVIASDRAAHGRYSAHFHGKGNVSNDDAFIVTRALSPALLTHHFGRLYFYVSVKPTSGHTMWVLGGTAAMSANPTLRDFEVATINGGWQLGFDSLNMTPGGEEVFYPKGQVPVARWTCLEWEFDDQPDTDTLWIESQELGTLDDQHIDYPAGHVAGTPIFDGKSAGLIGGFSTYSFGFYDWHPSVDFDLYLDDIVLDTKRVGCL
jgi:hypothetical protein